MALTAPGLPQYHGPRMAAMPRVAAGPMATADAYGAGNARDLMRLADVGQSAGLSMLARAQEEQRRLDHAYVRDAMNQARTAMLEGSAAIYAKNGIDAENAPEEMTALLSSVKTRFGACGAGSRSCGTGGAAGSGNIERQRLLEDAMAQMGASYSEAALRHKIRQGRVYELQTLEMQDVALLREVESIVRGEDMITGAVLDAPAAAAGAARGDDEAVPVGSEPIAVTPELVDRVEAETMPQPHMGDEIAKRIQLIRHNMALRHAGSPPEFIQATQDEAESRVHALVVDALTEREPEQALAYLNQEPVRAVMPSAAWAEKRNAVASVIRSTAIPRMAMEAYRNGRSSTDQKQLSATEVYELSLRFRNEEDRKAFLSCYADYAKRAESDAMAEYVEMKKDITDRYIAADYDIHRMSEIDQVAVKANPDIRKELEGLRKVMNELGKLEKDVAPNFPELDRVRAMSPEDINAWINEEGNYAQLMIWDAGKKTAELEEIFDKRRGKTPGGSRSGAGGDSGGFNKMAVSDMFQQSFGSINKNWRGSEIAYDPTDAEHKRQEANFRAIYTDRMGLFQEKEGRKPTYSEQREAFFTLMREVRGGAVKLDRPLADGDPIAAMDAPARAEAVNPETGIKEATFAPEAEGGAPETFEVLSRLALTSFAVNGIKEGFVAKAPGKRFGVAYETGDRILITVNPRTGKPDGVVLYDANYNFKTGKAGGGAAADAADFNARRSAPAPIPEPPKSPKMKAWEKEHGSVFVWEKYANRWNAVRPDPNDHRRTVAYQASPDGSIISALPFGKAVTDEDFTPPPDDEPEKVAQVLRKIERLEKDIAAMNRDPRTRQDVLADKKEEVEHLREEHKRITGENARASKRYVGERGKLNPPLFTGKK